MSNDRKKKGGQRKDKKMERMREDVAQRRAAAAPPEHQTDQKDIQTFKPGAADDRSSGPKAQSAKVTRPARF